MYLRGLPAPQLALTMRALLSFHSTVMHWASQRQVRTEEQEMRRLSSPVDLAVARLLPGLANFLPRAQHTPLHCFAKETGCNVILCQVCRESISTLQIAEQNRLPIFPDNLEHLNAGILNISRGWEWWELSLRLCSPLVWHQRCCSLLAFVAGQFFSFTLLMHRPLCLRL